MKLETIDKPSVKLDHGEYTIKMKQLTNSREKLFVIVDKITKPLNQEQLADGWLRVSNYNKAIVHHFSIYLSQLPSNLWGKLKRNYASRTDTEYYKKIKQHNYHYSIKYSKNDDTILELYKQIMCSRHNIPIIKELYKELHDNHTKGWLMIRTLRIINNH